MMRTTKYEWIRILSMIMIIGGHAVSFGGIFNPAGELQTYYLNGSWLNRLTVAFWSPGGAIGVDLFFMLTGFFLVKRREIHFFRKILAVTIFYSALTLVVVFIKLLLGRAEMLTSLVDILNYCLRPISRWWFPLAYCVLCCFAPKINNLILALSGRGKIFSLIFVWVVCYGMNGIHMNYLWNYCRAVLFYMIGAYISLSLNANSSRKHIYRFLSIFLAIIGWSFYAASYFEIHSGCVNESQISIIQYMLLAPATSVAIFLSLHFSDCQDRKSINIISSCMFGVYLFHTAGVYQEYMWTEVFQIGSYQYQLDLFPLTCFGSMLVVMTIGILLDLFRQKIAKKWIEAGITKGIEILTDRRIF